MPATPDSTSPPPDNHIDFVSSHYGHCGLLVCILLAFFLRTHQLADLPPAFDYDEAAHAMDTLEILAGKHAIFSHKVAGTPTLFMYLTVPFFYLLGPTTFAARLMVVFASTLTIPLTFVLTRAMFRAELGERRAAYVGLLAGVGLATSYWHTTFSRVNIEYNLVPLFEVLTFYFLWRGLVTKRQRCFVTSGLFLGLSTYIYHTPRFLPFVFVLFFLCLYRVHTSPKPDPASARAALAATLRPLAIAGTAALLAFAPLGAYFVLHPHDFVNRARATFFLNPAINHGDPWGTLLHSILGTLGAFGITSDMHPFANLPGKSILNPPLAVLHWAGLLWAVFRFRKPPYALLPIWWAVMLLPAFLTPDRVPQSGRMLSVAPLTYIFIALAVDGAWQTLSHLRSSGRNALLIRASLIGTCALIYGATALSTYQDYFFKWATHELTPLAFHAPGKALAEVINDDPHRDSTYLLPCYPDPGDSCAYYTLDFFHRDGAPLHYIVMVEPDALRQLAQAVQGKGDVRLIYLKSGKRKFTYPEADPKGLLQFMLGTQGRLVRTDYHAEFDILTYHIPATGLEFDQFRDFEPVNRSFANQLLLRSAAWGGRREQQAISEPETTPGDLAWAILEWDMVGPPDENYKTTLRLLDQHGHVVAQIDHTLFHYRRRGTSRWTQEEMPVFDYYLIPIPATTPPGKHALEVGVYAELDRLIPPDGTEGGLTLELGTLQILPPHGLPEYGDLKIAKPLATATTPAITLKGYELDATKPYAPGDMGTTTLFWQVEAPIAEDLNLQLSLGGERDWPLMDPQRPLGDEFPTTRWETGQVWKGIYEFTIPAQVPAGEYPVIGRFMKPGGTRYGDSFVLERIKVAGRPRNFSIPKIQYPLDARFDDKMTLLGYDLPDQEVRIGENLGLTLHWLAQETMDTSYTTFVHLLDADGVVRAQRDTVPGNGEMPTTGWLPGEVISDHVAVPLARGEMSPGRYRLEIGMYDAETGQRLHISSDAGQDPGDHLLLQHVTILPEE